MTDGPPALDRVRAAAAARGLSVDKYLETSAWLTLEEAAAFLKVKVKTMADWCYRKRLIPSYALGTGGRRAVRRIKRVDLEAFVQRGYQAPVGRVLPGRSRAAGIDRGSSM